MGMYAVYYTVPRLPNDNDLWNIYVALKSRIAAVWPDPHGKLYHSASRIMADTRVGTVRATFTLMPSTASQEKEWREVSRSDSKTQGELLRKEFANAGWHNSAALLISRIVASGRVGVACIPSRTCK